MRTFQGACGLKGLNMQSLKLYVCILSKTGLAEIKINLNKNKKKKNKKDNSKNIYPTACFEWYYLNYNNIP